jgi:hypothetical protein
MCGKMDRASEKSTTVLLDRGEDCAYLPAAGHSKRSSCVKKCWSKNPGAAADFRRELRQVTANHLLGQLLRSHTGGLKRTLTTAVETTLNVG